MATNLLSPLCRKYLIFTLFLSNILSQNHAENELKQRINIILVGGTGDLAKRYLWNGFFNLYSSLHNTNSDDSVLHFYAGAREDNETGNRILLDILNTSVKCSNAKCNKMKAEFIKRCTYHSLKITEDYESLQKLLETSLTNKETEIGRIFYLSVPPFAYEKISRNIAEKCRPNSLRAWVRVVLEKPFGSDLMTARELAEKLSKYWKEDEIYRIDHYLGKAGVAQIMEFKKENLDFFEKMWNREHIEQVNIVVKERLDAQGRLGFYDQYGVIRDVFQNHLTEILSLVALEMSEHNSEKPCQDSVKQLGNFEKFIRNSEKPLGNSEKLLENSEKSFEFSEKLLENSQKLLENSEKLLQNSEKLLEKQQQNSGKPARNFEKHITDSEKLSDISGKLLGNSETPLRTFDKLAENVETPIGDSKKPFQNSKKSALLRAVKAVTIHDAVFGQYEEYNKQLKQELPNIEANSNTLTFSAVVMEIQNDRWSGVPFVLLSGKSLDSRLAYVQLQFKQNIFCIKDNLNNDPENCKPRELTFYIQGESVHYPLTIFSRKLPYVKFSNNWLNLTLDSELKSQFKGENIIMKPPNTEHDAYSSLIREVFLGNKDKFVNVDDLLLSWKIWNPLLEASALIQPRLYTRENMDSLDFEIVDGKIRFVSGSASDCETSGPTKHDDGRLHSFRGNRLVSGLSMDVVRQLANDIAVAIHAKVQSSRATFHLALSGGSTSKHLFQALASMKYIPWKNVHVWLVDERCVSLTHEDSNFKNMYQHLLKDISIPYFNIHPMFVDVAGQFCKPNDLGDKHYERQLRYLVNGSLDFVVLGVGNDGHTASLFPASDLLTSTNWVELTSSLGSYNRMTMTLRILNQARNIAVLILGGRKHEIVQKLAQAGNDVRDFPITAVKPEHGSLVWYIDDNALHYATLIAL